MACRRRPAYAKNAARGGWPCAAQPFGRLWPACLNASVITLVKAASLRRRHRRYKHSAPAGAEPFAREPDCPVYARMVCMMQVYLRPCPGETVDDAAQAALTRDLQGRIEKHRRACPTCKAVQGPLDVA